MPPPVGGSSGGCPAVWSISNHRGYCSRESTVRPPHPCSSSCEAPLLGRRPPPGLCASRPVISCFRGSRRCLPWSPMQPGSARTSSLGVPPGPSGRLGRPCAPNPGGVGRGALSLCCPRCMCVCGVLAHVAPVHRCARCVRCTCAVCCIVILPPSPNFLFFSFLFLSVFVLFCRAFLFFKWKRGRAHTAGTGMGNWCSGAIVLCSLVCVVGALVDAAPRWCGSRVLMYTGTVQGGFGWLHLFF